MDNYKLEFTIHGWTKGFVTGFIKRFKQKWDSHDGDILVAFGHRFTSNTVHTFEEVGNNPIVLQVYRSIISGNCLTEPDKILIATLTVRDDNIATFQCSDPLSLPESELTDWLNDKFTISNPPAIDASPVIAEEAETEPTQDHSPSIDESRSNLTAAEQGRLPIARQAIKAKRDGMEFKDFCAQRGDDPTPATLRRWIRDLKRKGVDGLDWN